MTLQVSRADDGSAVLRIVPFDPRDRATWATLKAIKALPGRTYDGPRSAWRVPASDELAAWLAVTDYAEAAEPDTADLLARIAGLETELAAVRAESAPRKPGSKRPSAPRKPAARSARPTGRGHSEACAEHVRVEGYSRALCVLKPGLLREDGTPVDPFYSDRAAVVAFASELAERAAARIAAERAGYVAVSQATAPPAREARAPRCTVADCTSRGTHDHFRRRDGMGPAQY